MSEAKSEASELSAGLCAGTARRRVRTVEYDPGFGWIARDPLTGLEIPEAGFRWMSRSVARSVVLETSLLRAHNASFSREPERSVGESAGSDSYGGNDD